tara:strand:- start:1955 stop:2083 length:129 start_codon:yes stop_codon:yes gene_type:complete
MSKAEKLYLDILKMIREKAKNMSDDEVYKFHEMLKDWFNKTI